MSLGEEILYGGDAVPPDTDTGQLRVTINVSENFSNPPQFAYRLQVSAESLDNADPYIFVYESLGDVPGRPEDAERFVTVATPAYMHELPILEPSVNSQYFFRRSDIDLYYRTPSEVVNARDEILRRIRNLLDSIDKMSTGMRQSQVVTWTFETDDPYSSISI